MAARLVTTNNTLEPVCGICVNYRLSISLIRECDQASSYNGLFYGSLHNRLTDAVVCNKKKVGEMTESYATT
jgi:hypothetical protein